MKPFDTEQPTVRIPTQTMREVIYPTQAQSDAGIDAWNSLSSHPDNHYAVPAPRPPAPQESVVHYPVTVTPLGEQPMSPQELEQFRFGLAVAAQEAQAFQLGLALGQYNAAHRAVSSLKTLVYLGIGCFVLLKLFAL